MASSIPAAKAKVLELLRARAALNAVQVEWAHPGKNVAKEALWMGDAFGEDTAAAISTTSPRDEKYGLPVVVSVLHEGNSGQAAEERMWALVAEVEAAIDPRAALANVGGVLQAVVESKSPTTFPESGGHVAECIVVIRVHARI